MHLISILVSIVIGFWFYRSAEEVGRKAIVWAMVGIGVYCVLPYPFIFWLDQTMRDPLQSGQITHATVGFYMSLISFGGGILSAAFVRWIFLVYGEAGDATFQNKRRFIKGLASALSVIGAGLLGLQKPLAYAIAFHNDYSLLIPIFILAGLAFWLGGYYGFNRKGRR